MVPNQIGSWEPAAQPTSIQPYFGKIRKGGQQPNENLLTLAAFSQVLCGLISLRSLSFFGVPSRLLFP